MRWMGDLCPFCCQELCAQPDWQLPLSRAVRRLGWGAGFWIPGVPALSSLVQPGQSSPEAFGRSIWTSPAPSVLRDDAKQSSRRDSGPEGGRGAFPGSQTEIEVGSCRDSGGGTGQPGPRCSQPARQAQPVFGEVAESEFQEAITLVETSFLWPGLVTWLGGGPTSGRATGLGRLTPHTPATAATLCSPQRLKGEAGGGRKVGSGALSPPHPNPKTHTHTWHRPASSVAGSASSSPFSRYG